MCLFYPKLLRDAFCETDEDGGNRRNAQNAQQMFPIRSITASLLTDKQALSGKEMMNSFRLERNIQKDIIPIVLLDTEIPLGNSERRMIINIRQ